MTQPAKPVRIDKRPRTVAEVNELGVLLFGAEKWAAHTAARERARLKGKERGIANNSLSIDAFCKGKPDD